MTEPSMNPEEALERIEAAIGHAYNERLHSWAYSSEAYKALNQDQKALSILRDAVEENKWLKAVMTRERDEQLIDFGAAMEWRGRAEKAEAKLARYAPLIEAIKKMDVDGLLAELKDLKRQNAASDEIQVFEDTIPIIRAALKVKGKK